MLRSTCRTDGEYRPCDRCGSKEETSLSATTFECARCRAEHPGIRPSTAAAQVAAQQYSRDVVLTAMRAEEDALHAKNRTKPPEAYLPHTYTVLEAVRPAEGDALPAGINALVKRCQEAGIRYAVSKALATDTNGFGDTAYVESVSFLARTPYGGLFVAYEGGRFVRALGPMILGKGNLRDAKRALGIDVTRPDVEKTIRKDHRKYARPAGKADTLR